MDGKNSAVRYYKNNFCDGYRQDSLDFFLGNYEYATGARSPFHDVIQMKVLLLKGGWGHVSESRFESGFVCISCRVDLRLSKTVSNFKNGGSWRRIMVPGKIRGADEN